MLTLLITNMGNWLSWRDLCSVSALVFSNSCAVLLPGKTVITRGPEDRSVNATQDVILHCDATTDNAEVSKLRIEWLRNGNKIDYETEGRLSMNMQDHSLKITGAQVMDTAEYTCIASNGLDSVSQKAKLTVKGMHIPLLFRVK